MNEEKENWQNDGIFLLALPDATLDLVRKLSRITGKAFPDVVAESIMLFYEKHRDEIEPKKEQEEEKPKKAKVRFGNR